MVVDRGPSSYLTNLEIYCNDHHVTSVQGDGKMHCSLMRFSPSIFVPHFAVVVARKLKQR